MQAFYPSSGTNCILYFVSYTRTGDTPHYQPIDLVHNHNISITDILLTNQDILHLVSETTLRLGPLMSVD